MWEKHAGARVYGIEVLAGVFSGALSASTHKAGGWNGSSVQSSKDPR